MEDWKIIQDVPVYEVNSLGQVRRSNRSKGATVGRVLKQRLNSKGYVQYALQSGGQVFYRQAHRLVLESFVGPCPTGYECRHLDGNPTNNSLSNLVWGSRSENMLDKRNHGTAWNGGSPRKFSTEQIADIRNKHSRGQSMYSLAKDYGVAIRTVEMIVKRLSYIDLP